MRADCKQCRAGLRRPGGAGKSTCFNLISGALEASAGSIKFMGTELIGQSASDIAKLGLGRTFQHVKLVGTMTVVENVALGAYLRGSKGIIASSLRLNTADEAAALAEAMRQLERVGLASHAHDAANSLPLGKQRIVEIEAGVDAKLAAQIAPRVAEILQEELGIDPQLDAFLALTQQYASVPQP